MPSTSQILDLADILAAEGTLDLDQPQTADDMRAAAAFAVEAVRQAYRVAYKHTNGDLDHDLVDALDLAEVTIREALDAFDALTA
ncbi:hypothetical protein [Streptomyces erythrochromogenes]|uniref:hypothetical protein n=1 Tax=Streptomyces erythrochromogenes TaxID=285574 RepID=UPI0037D9866E